MLCVFEITDNTQCTDMCQTIVQPRFNFARDILCGFELCFKNEGPKPDGGTHNFFQTPKSWRGRNHFLFNLHGAQPLFNHFVSSCTTGCNGRGGVTQNPVCQFSILAGGSASRPPGESLYINLPRTFGRQNSPYELPTCEWKAILFRLEPKCINYEIEKW